MAPLLAQVPPQIPAALVARGVVVLAALYGAVSFELFGQFHNVIEQTPQARAVWFNVMVNHWAATVWIA
jgi:hypothetical protein